MSTSNLAFIAELQTVVQQRLREPSKNSYTAELAAAGTKRMAQKVGEEGVELALAAVAGDRDETINEAADLLYHMIVLLNGNGICLEDVAAKLETRHSSR